ncbi:Bug family tripartite tricarboxylate transporter substrate binding protein [Pigmentiphaga litoralis]|uniref:Tripartite-type tricarboxylate transporter receptor subunit TctC n=1 Tax=Pigmentiphaga litoralis TaxID=516702 RepID=A0A7Y9IRT0_9BURK|nr:tripartite tricarboxylate transporter substrate binding protein [Pigmentiphaga litoralis]NYE24615.1 tripartite-type tricarboxylate transporter receptor subunit TctC [Pigmentiphaga litoralis]NYE81771.1 tripartite-type tricarboxylate transporter receptor subunit TctC [Pigmentiphaga litoralis]
MQPIRYLSLAVAATFAAFSTTGAQAQTYPTRTVTLVAPSTPGSTPDVLARLVAQRLTQVWGQSVVVINKAGAGGDIGADSVVRAEADGYTVLLGHIALTVNPHFQKKRQFELNQLTPVSLIANAPDLLVVHPSFKVNNVKELVAHLKQNPSTPAGHAGSGTTPQLSLAMFALDTKAPFVTVPYQGGGAAQLGILSNQIPFMFSTSVGVLPHVRSGKLHAIAVTSKQRLAAAPDVPTMAESGLPGFDLSAWFGLFVPAKTPQPIVDKIAQTAKTIVESPEFSEKLKEMGAESSYMPPQQFKDYVAAENTKWGRLVEAAGLRTD